MPREIAGLVYKKGVERIILCISHEHPKRRGLNAWARRCGFKKYDEANERDWYVQPLPLGERNGKG
jgi:hypothetical protein